MSVLLMMLSPLPANLEQCIAAVRNAPATAVQACEGPKSIDIFATNNPAPECVAALAAGQQVGKYAAAVPAMRKALSAEFDKKLELCKSPPAKKEIPIRKTTNLWD